MTSLFQSIPISKDSGLKSFPPGVSAGLFAVFLTSSFISELVVNQQRDKPWFNVEADPNTFVTFLESKKPQPICNVQVTDYFKGIPKTPAS